MRGSSPGETLIARGLGASVMTVSKAVRHPVDISSKTRSRVLKRARELGYQPSWAARSLAAHRTYIAGLVMHSFVAEVAKAMHPDLARRSS